MCERERERGRNNLFVMKNYAKNGRENNKFIKDGVSMKRQNKRRWMERWIMTLRLRVVGRWKDKGIRKIGESSIINDVDADVA